MHWTESLANSENGMCKGPVAGSAGMYKQRKQHVPVQESTNKKGAVEGDKAILWARFCRVW